jgi:hypothetical protein
MNGADGGSFRAMQVKYFAWLESQLEDGKSLNEYDAASQLETFRK